MSLFATQLITSFLVGGGVITLLSFLAERAKPSIAGLIIFFPSTVAIGFIFLSLVNSPQAVANIIPSTLIPLGISTFFPIFYLLIASKTEKFTQSKLIQIIISLISTIGIWFLLILPTIYFKPTNLPLILIIYGILIFISHTILKQKSVIQLPPTKYTISQKIFRAIFIGSIITGIVYISKTINPFWGGILTMYPAALTSVLLIFHLYHPPHTLYGLAQKVPLGSINIAIYTLTVMLTYPELGILKGTLIAYTISTLFYFTILKLTKKNANL